jgi:aminopeptidase N
MNRDFFHQTVTSAQIETYLSSQTGIDLTAFFNQYLRTAEIPVLEYKQEGTSLKYRYTQNVSDFDMPVRVSVNGEPRWIYPNAAWKSEPIPAAASLEFDPNFLVTYSKI